MGMQIKIGYCQGSPACRPRGHRRRSGDSRQADCEVRKDGNRWKGRPVCAWCRSGAGTSRYDLSNGDSYDLQARQAGESIPGSEKQQGCPIRSARRAAIPLGRGQGDRRALGPGTAETTAGIRAARGGTRTDAVQPPGPAGYEEQPRDERDVAERLRAARGPCTVSPSTRPGESVRPVAA